MKALHRRLLILLLSVISVVCLAFGLAACTPEDGPKGGDGKTDSEVIKLDTPVLTLSRDVISWEKVNNADNYEIFEDGEKVATQVELTYRVPEKEAGEYKFSVKATSVNENYSESDLSEIIAFTVVRLAKPQISDIEDGVISWSKVENADSYEIFQNGVSISATTALNYTITADNPDTYSYNIVALSENHAFEASEQSETKQYTVPWRATVIVSFVDVENFKGESVTVALYKGNNEVDSEEVKYSPNNIYDSAIFTVPADNYTAKLKDLTEGYVATWAHITAETSQVTIMIAEDSGEKLQVGENTYVISPSADPQKPNEAIGAPKTYVFTATKSGTFSLTTEEKRDFTISVNGNLKIDALQGKIIDTFDAEEGETFIITISAMAEGEYKFNLLDHEVKQYIGISEGYGINPVNIIRSDCKRYINIEEDEVYTVQFAPAAYSVVQEVTFTINGESYVFGGGNEWYLDISFKAGTDIEIQITVKGSSGDDIPFFVFPKGAGQA